MSKVTDMDYEAAGQLSSTDLHLIIATAVEGHDKQCLAYHALTNNYTSSMCSSNPKKPTHKDTTSSPIFMQHNIMHNANITENIISLPNLRSTIHKLQPKDLEYPILDSATSTFGNNGPNEDSIGYHSGTTPHLCTCTTYQELLDIIQTTFTMN